MRTTATGHCGQYKTCVLSTHNSTAEASFNLGQSQWWTELQQPGMQPTLWSWGHNSTSLGPSFLNHINGKVITSGNSYIYLSGQNSDKGQIIPNRETIVEKLLCSIYSQRQIIHVQLGLTQPEDKIYHLYSNHLVIHAQTAKTSGALELSWTQETSHLASRY